MTNGLRVLLTGPEWFGGLTEAVAGALAAEGCTVTTVPYLLSDWWRQQGLRRKARIWGRMLIGGERYDRRESRRFQTANHRLLLAAAARERPDVVVIIKGCTIAAETVTALRQGGTRIWLWLVDDPLIDWSAASSFRTDDVRKYPLSDRVFLFDQHYVPQMRQLFGERCRYLPLACDDRVFRPLGLPRRYPVAFVGSGSPHRARLFARLADRGLNLWGHNWPELSACVRGGIVMPDAANRIYNESNIVVNLNHPQSVHDTNARTFEVPGSGSFVLTDHRPALDRMFAAGRELVAFRSEAECLELVDYYLAHPDEAAAIAAAGRQRVLAEHTYRHRVRAMLADGLGA